MASPEDALVFKQKGNTAVANHEWLEAVDFYTRAIDINSQDATFFCNRAQVKPPQ